MGALSDIFTVVACGNRRQSGLLAALFQPVILAFAFKVGALMNAVVGDNGIYVPRHGGVPCFHIPRAVQPVVVGRREGFLAAALCGLLTERLLELLHFLGHLPMIKHKPDSHKTQNTYCDVVRLHTLF